MIEIIVLYMLCVRMGELLRGKGWENPIWMQVAVVAVWLTAAVVAGLGYGVFHALMHGSVDEDISGLAIYPFVLGAGVISEVILFLIARSLPDRRGPPPVSRLRYTRLGVASFITPIIASQLTMGLLVSAMIFFWEDDDAFQSNDPIAYFVGIVLFAVVIACVAALIMGIVDVCRKQARNVFGVLGIVFSLFYVVTLVGLAVFLPG